MNLLNLSTIAHDKKTSLKFLQDNGIVHKIRFCKQNHSMNLLITDRQDRWRCSHVSCNENIPLRNGTWLEGSRITYRQIVLFIYCWSKEMTSINFCQAELKIGKDSAIKWNNNIREVCANKLITNPSILGGPNTTVEIDESMFTRRKNEVGRILPQQWVFGGICRETRESFIVPIQNRSKETLMPIISANILPGTKIISDRWRAYNAIDMLPGYTHETVNHSVNFVDPRTGANTQRIERLWKTAKERNKRHNGTHRHMLHSYMCEFMWRCRIKVHKLDAFNSILQDIAVFWPPV